MPPPSHELHCTLPSSCCEHDINKKINASLGWHLMPRRHRKRSHSLSPSDRCLPPPPCLLLPRRTTHQILHCLCNQAFLVHQLISDWALYSGLPTPAWNWNFAPPPSPSPPFRGGVGLQDIIREGFVLVPRTLYSSSVAWRDVVPVVIFNPSVVAG